VIFRVKLQGTGTPADPYRANLPTYSALAVDVPGATMTVFVPPSTLGFDKAPPTAPVLTPTVVGNAITALAAPDASAAQTNLDTLYTYPPGTFKLEPK